MTSKNKHWIVKYWGLILVAIIFLLPFGIQLYFDVATRILQDRAERSRSKFEQSQEEYRVLLEELEVLEELEAEETIMSSGTIGQGNAFKQALNYLDVMAFSSKGLVEQLEYEGYSHADAVWAVDRCGANWNEQAALKAEDYLDTMAFSREGLIDQLIYEGFTREQAIYGVTAVGY